MAINFELIKQRRNKLRQQIEKLYPQKKGTILLFASFEPERTRFRQDSTFYYYTGLEEPGVVLALDLSGSTKLYVPNYGEARTKWVASDVYTASKEMLAMWGIDSIEPLGNACKSYTFSCLFSDTEYQNLLEVIKQNIAQNKTIFTSNPAGNQTDQKLVLERLYNFMPNLAQNIQDISAIIASDRRTKSQTEIEALYTAVDCTMSAQEAAAHIIEPEKFEYQVQAGIEFVFTETGGRVAFPSIVASGKNSTVLHYQVNNSLMKKGDLVIVDIGAELDYYCADITRTYPVSGLFSKRQREIYTLVQETQAYIADLAQPGMFLRNSAQPENSLQHLAQKFLEKTGYGKYFTHGIGHYLGLDVHDVGSYAEPLKEGDIFTIEPGIYIPEERVGIRIEDDYWMGKDGVICLSEELPKNPEDIEAMMAGALDTEE